MTRGSIPPAAISGCSADGSALGSGPRGRWFDSSHPDYARLAERRGSGLTRRPRRFDSCTVQTPEWRNGRRTRFSDGRSRDRGGSTPLSGIMRAWRNGRRTRLRIWRSVIVEVRLLSPALLLDLELDADTIDTHDSRTWRNWKTLRIQTPAPKERGSPLRAAGETGPTKA